MIYVAVVGCILWLAALTRGESCDGFTDETSCSFSQACDWVGGQCKCASDVKLDILFNIDTSGSIGFAGFQIQKQFITTLVTQGINNGSRIGFFLFDTEVNQSRGIQEWDSDELEDFTNGLYFSAGFTNTPGVLQASITEFDRTFDQSRKQILMLITDGRPCLPQSMGGCPLSVCNYAAQFALNDIRVVIIAVGEGLYEHVGCLTQSDDDFIPVAAFTTDDFNSIMSGLSGALCPVAIAGKFTEIKAAKKESDLWGYRWSRFVEFYNTGIDLNLNDIYLSGLVDMSIGSGPDITVSQDQYVVFYDAADDSIVTDESTLTCHLCGNTCDLSNCAFAGEINAGYCWCENALYIACSNTADSTCANAALSSDNGESATNACSVCTFNDDMTRDDWNIEMGDADTIVDSVEYDASTWISTDDGFSYELVSKGFNNDVGYNWAESCSVFGTPGADPSATCTAGCTTDGCGADNYCSTDTNLCVCDTSLGYYPQCTSATSCTKCAQIYEPDSCVVTWYKSFNFTGTGQMDRYAVYEWDANANMGDSEFSYRLTYFAGSANGDGVSVGSEDAKLFETIYTTADVWYGNNSYGGYVETAKEVCTGDNVDVCSTYYSQKTLCAVITPQPTQAPTDAPIVPTEMPTSVPTEMPTTGAPTAVRTNEPTAMPTDMPSVQPTDFPSTQPTNTMEPTGMPTTQADMPTTMPTEIPSTEPTIAGGNMMEPTSEPSIFIDQSGALSSFSFSVLVFGALQSLHTLLLC